MFTNADGIDLDLHGGRCFGRQQRVELAGIILAVGHKDHDFAFGLQIAQPVHGGAEAVADSGGVLVNVANFQPVEIFLQVLVIQRQRGADERLRGE